MPYSQQSYTGQGITQQNQVDRSGEHIARGIEAFGQAMAKRGERIGESKTLRGKLMPFAEELAPKYNVEPTEWKAFLEDQSRGDLKGIADSLTIQSAVDLLKQNQIQKDESEGDSQFMKLVTGGMSEGDAARTVFGGGGRLSPTVFGDVAERKRSIEQAARFGNMTGTTVPEGTDLTTAKAAADYSANKESQGTLNAYRQSMIDRNDALTQEGKDKATREALEAAMRGGLTEKQATMSMNMFDKLNSSAPVKQFNVLKGQYSALENIILSKDKLEGAGDIATIFTFMKSLDPNSVVRESEFQVAARTGGLEERLVNAYTKLKDGEFLTSEMKHNFLSAAKEAAKSYTDAANSERQRYVDQGARFKIPEEYSGGKPYLLNSKAFSSASAAEKAGDSGALKPGDTFWVYDEAEKDYVPMTLEDKAKEDKAEGDK